MSNLCLFISTGCIFTLWWVWLVCCVDGFPLIVQAFNRHWCFCFRASEVHSLWSKLLLNRQYHHMLLIISSMCIFLMHPLTKIISSDHRKDSLNPQCQKSCNFSFIVWKLSSNLTPSECSWVQANIKPDFLNIKQKQGSITRPTRVKKVRWR